MRVPLYVRRAIRSFIAWQAKNRLYRAVPELRDLDRQQAQNARLHKAGSRYIAKQKQRAVNARLAAEIGARQ